MSGIVIENDVDKYPLVTFVLFTYNQEKFIQEAVELYFNTDKSDGT